MKYDVTTKAIKKKTFPEKDEEFIKQLGDYESWGDFETKLREDANSRKKDALENQAKDKLLGDLIERYQFLFRRRLCSSRSMRGWTVA